MKYEIEIKDINNGYYAQMLNQHGDCLAVGEGVDENDALKNMSINFIKYLDTKTIKPIKKVNVCIVKNILTGWNVVKDGKKVDNTKPLFICKELNTAKQYCNNNNFHVIKVC